MNLNKFKICLILPSLQTGGMERVLIELGNYFSENGLFGEIHLISLVESEIHFSYDKNMIIHIPKFNYKDYSKINYTLKTFSFLRRKIIEISPDIILNFGDHYNSFVILASSFLKPKVFISNRRNPFLSNGFFIDSLNRHLYRFASGIIAQTEIAKNEIIKKSYNSNITVIPNPVKLLTYENLKRENIILNVGRFIDTKNQKLLLQYFFDLKKYDWRLVFCGEGPKLEEVKDLAKQLGLEDYVSFEGNIREINAFYQKARIFAFTSTSEGFPNVLIEAMSAGLACISFDCETGPSDIIQNDVDGYLISNFDHHNYKLKLKELMENEYARNIISENALKKSLSFSMDIVGKRYYDFLTKI
jgi:GalNAc-alpha-(1->4)-GalNAc-alpha-(1->3)-diNAcBac-PP-undecaprenol alpha-1,4-N-acetyl-D-galactosaminyltransferase